MKADEGQGPADALGRDQVKLAAGDLKHVTRVARVLRWDSAKTRLALGHFRPLFQDVRPLFGHNLFLILPLRVDKFALFIADLGLFQEIFGSKNYLFEKKKF